MRMNGGAEDQLGHRTSAGLRFRQATEVVMEEQAAQALLETLHRSEIMFTENHIQEFLAPQK